jgi:hypothetical protein
MKYELRWENDNSGYGNGRNCYLGRYKVASVYYDGATTKDSENKYRATCCLPGVKNDFGLHKTEEAAIVKIEYVINHWVSKAFGSEED